LSANSTAAVNNLDEVQVALDVKHLDQSTFGDAALRSEIIKLFTMQLEQSRARIVEAASAQDWRFVMHTLKGAAAAVGAVEVAKLANNWEANGFPPDQSAKHLVLMRYDLAQMAFVAAAQRIEAR
jgi:HPt (histidine-containing phosphotransfer) domain-containing protein